jgi:hypothetical protein
VFGNPRDAELSVAVERRGLQLHSFLQAVHLS